MKFKRDASSTRFAVAAGGGVILLAAMAFNTKVIEIGSVADVRADVFSAATYGKSEFPKVQALVESRATDAAVVADAIGKDQAAAEKQFGVAADAGPEISVKFTGKAGKQESGVYDVTVAGMPGGVQISVQTGPAITGTDLRDATGTIAFGQFSNQIEYQNAGSALNKEMKAEVLSRIDTSDITGKTISVIGVFQLTDASNWLVTPVKLDIR